METEKKDDLNARQRRFVNAYVTTMNASKAAIEAGYSEKTSRSIGQRLLTYVDIQLAIDEELSKIYNRQKRTLMRAADSAINALIDTVQNGRGLARVNAANSILDRSGHKPVDKVESTVDANVKGEMSIVDARQQLLEKLNNCYPNPAQSSQDNVIEPGSGSNLIE